MDELLKACARQRRVEAGPPLDPATRNLFQAEVRRVFHGPSPAEPAGFPLPLFWRRLLLGGSCLALLLIGAGLWLRFDREREEALARDQESKLMLFTQSAPNDSTREPVETSTVHERLRRFELGAVDQNNVASAPAQPEIKAGRPTETEALAKAVTLSMATASDRVQVALAPSSKDTEMLSNAATLAAGLTPSATPQSTANEGTAPLPEAEAAQSAWAMNTLNRAVRATAPAQAVQPVQAGPALMEQRIVAPAAQAPLALAAPSGASSGLASAFEGGGNNQALYFQQVDPASRYRRNMNSPPPPKLLRTFELRQTGQNIRIVDADGSVYDGVVQAPSAGQDRALTRTGTVLTKTFSYGRAGAPAAPAKAAPTSTPMTMDTYGYAASGSGQALFFRAVGTNQTLNQRVEFTGELEPGGLGAGPGHQQVSLDQLSETDLARRASGAQLTQATTTGVAGRVNAPQAGRIEGQVTVGKKNQFRIQAQQIEH